jgi:hypothetical protein
MSNENVQCTNIPIPFIVHSLSYPFIFLFFNSISFKGIAKKSEINKKLINCRLAVGIWDSIDYTKRRQFFLQSTKLYNFYNGLFSFT